ncbi:hypothetical protein AWC21_28870 [Mycolicibacterium peregrinum]|nr:hypothetical protein AWC21_28870 [Mycolicibacterium peregrinum]
MGRRAFVEEWPRGYAVSGRVDPDIPLALLVVGQRPAGLAVAGDERIQIDQRAHTVRDAVRDRRDHHAAVAVPDQYRIGDAVSVEIGQHIGDVSVQIDPGVSQVGAFGDPGQGRRQHPAAVGPQRSGQVVEAPAAVARTGYEYICDHRELRSASVFRR